MPLAITVQFVILQCNLQFSTLVKFENSRAISASLASCSNTSSASLPASSDQRQYVRLSVCHTSWLAESNTVSGDSARRPPQSRHVDDCRRRATDRPQISPKAASSPAWQLDQPTTHRPTVTQLAGWLAGWLSLLTLSHFSDCFHEMTTNDDDDDERRFDALVLNDMVDRPVPQS